MHVIKNLYGYQHWMKFYLFPAKAFKAVNCSRLSDEISSFYIIRSFFTVAIFTESITITYNRLNIRHVLLDNELCSEGVYLGVV